MNLFERSRSALILEARIGLGLLRISPFTVIGPHDVGGSRPLTLVERMRYTHPGSPVLSERTLGHREATRDRRRYGR